MAQTPEKEHKPKARGNGTGSVYKLPNGKWRVAVTMGYTEDKKRIYKTKSGFNTKKEALAYIPVLQQKNEIIKDIKFFLASAISILMFTCSVKKTFSFLI